MISENRCKTPVLLVLQQLQFKVDHSISCHQLLFSNPSRDYVISYDKRNRTAHWVFEHLTKASVARNEEVDRQKSSFIEDEAVHPFFRSTNADYKVNLFFHNFLLTKFLNRFCTYYLILLVFISSEVVSGPFLSLNLLGFPLDYPSSGFLIKKGDWQLDSVWFLLQSHIFFLQYSGFDRGHLAPAANHRLNQAICDETFLMSNMSPQVGAGFNRDKWEHLERYTLIKMAIYHTWNMLEINNKKRAKNSHFVTDTQEV